MEILKAENIDKTYNNSLIDKVHLEKKNTVLRGISLEVGEGDSICIMGKSGCGKTTLLKILGTIDKATHGNVIYNGINIRKYSDVEMSELRRKNIGFSDLTLDETRQRNNCNWRWNVFTPPFPFRC